MRRLEFVLIILRGGLGGILRLSCAQSKLYPPVTHTLSHTHPVILTDLTEILYFGLIFTTCPGDETVQKECNVGGGPSFI